MACVFGQYGGRLARLGLVGLLTLACQPMTDGDQPMAVDKITFDLEQLDDNGLYGPPDGKRSLDYEFCVPGEPVLVETVQAIDPSLTLYPESPGRIGCTAEQVLAIGHTHQPNAVLILMELANLDFIERIDRVDWE
ncbi:hypothetical protein GFS31_38490 [Leptolyngbya sp. BL0902]|uniref:hypothetical protein n=1 Tax=Leptolyngbya sp. BL0902 TaxID=1115757 RepID=UPI001937ABC9|nr:hypothetical protein [Leptolyngbya sp. BL0902]QQE67137.1 hypothetical protein GFS31_38490 [Leptolyngbya sp. BL0902]